MHSKAVEKISNKIIGSLKNCLVKDSWPQYESFSVHVDSLAEEILKHKKEWLERIDVFSIFYDLVCESLNSVIKSDEYIEGNLWVLLGEDNSQQLAETLKDYFVSIPRTFDIYIPIPEVSQNLPSLIELSEALSIVSFPETDKILGDHHRGLVPFIGNKREIEKVYIRQRISGYAGCRLENICVKKALNNISIILQLALFNGLFMLTPEDELDLSLLGVSTYHRIKKSEVVNMDNACDEPKISRVELPIDVCRLLNNIDINWKNESIVKAVERNELDKAITASLRRPVQLIECMDEEAKRVRAAIKWCFDSNVVENQTLAFLQVCIGLEALLGDDAGNGALTETLADRCSYLIGESIKDRKVIKENFKELYRVRSKLVHGNVSELNSDQSQHLNWGKNILKLAISKEMKHLNLR